MSLHSDTLSWFRANQSLLFLLTAACLAAKQQIPISVFGLTRSGGKPTIYSTLGEHTKHYTTDAVDIKLGLFINQKEVFCSNASQTAYITIFTKIKE